MGFGDVRLNGGPPDSSTPDSMSERYVEIVMGSPLDAFCRPADALHALHFVGTPARIALRCGCPVTAQDTIVTDVDLRCRTGCTSSAPYRTQMTRAQ
jgi:hypothetical protein